MTGRRDTRDTDYGHSRLTRYFDDFLNDVGLTRTHGGIRRMGPGEDKHASWSPAIDITENDREYVIIADIPGVRKEDLDVELHQTMLEISGQNHQDPHVIAQLAQEIGVGKDNQQYQNQQYQNQNQQQPQQYHPAQPQIVNEPQSQNYQTQQQYPQYPNQQPQVTTQPNQPTQTTQPNQSTQPNQPTQSTQPNQPTQTTQSNQPTQTTQSTQQPIQEYQHTKHNRQRDRENRENNSSKIHVQERPYGYFSRTIQLPNDIKMEDNFQASLESGVLKIRVPKSSDKPRRKITVT